MKKRYDEVQRCKVIIGERLTRAGIAFELAVRRIYHDHEEVTACLAWSGKSIRHAAVGVSGRS
jgi:23S rRNA (cytidine2498-2'-O)-methyltransferase